MNNLAKLRNHEKEIERLKRASSGSREFSLWRRETEQTLKNLFGEDSVEVQEFNAIYYTPVFLTCRMDDEAFEEAYRKGLEEAEVFLKDLLSKIRQRPAR